LNVLYHLTAPPPVVAGTDAVVQEIDALRARFGGEVNCLYPFRRPGRRLPRFLYGLHQLGALREAESSVDIHHVYGPDLYVYPVLRRLRRPVVYTVTTSLSAARARSRRALAAIHTVVVSNPRDLVTARSWGIERAVVIRPGIDLSRFRVLPPRPPDGTFRLLCGSAPWTARQFRSKGVDALLDAAAQLPWLSLVFLWRGVLLEAMQRRVRRLGLESRVHVLAERVDVARLLGDVDAAVVLSEHPTLVKAFPHSLLEALVAGKPVLVSRCIPIADYVEETGCGVVVQGLGSTQVRTGLERLKGGYGAFHAQALSSGAAGFSQDAMVEAYGSLYGRVVGPLADESKNR
jgi:glycosyltransferase involved in cell wall biosynthesis